MKMTAKNNKSNVNLNCWYSRHNWVTIIFIAAISFYLITEHSAHLWGLLPWLILLACPLMHLFMHHGHGEHDHSSHEPNKENKHD
jgi:L-asparagine transporter-like permease